MSKNVSKIVQTCFDVIFSRFFGQCTLEGREVEKFQRNAKTSQISRYPNTFPKVSKQVLNLFWGFFSKKSAQCTLEGRNLEKLKKNWKTLVLFQNDQNLSQKCSNTFSTSSEVVFLVKKNWPVHPGGSKLGTIRKKIENNLKFKKCPKTLLRLSKQFLRWFYRNFLFSAPWRVETWKKFKKLEKISIVQNARKNVPKSNQTCFQHASRYFLAKNFAQCTLGGRNLQKTQKCGKTSKLSKFSKNVPKNIVWACFAWLFRRKRALPSETWRFKKIRKNRKDFKNSKSRKTLSKVSKLAWGSFFELFLPSATWRSKFVKLGRINRKKIEFSKVSKNNLESLHRRFELVFRQFSRKKVPIAPCRVDTWKNFKKLEKLSIFQNA